jgi:polyisoprenoid-binding protein YceI
MKTNRWSIDPAHSEIQFKVKHLMISTVTGQFNKFDAVVETENEDFANSKINFTAEIDSISTNNAQRDAHLKANDFFNAEIHPRLSFKSEKLEKTNDENYLLYGILTMRGISKKEIFNVDFGGVTKDPWGNTRAGFEISGKVNRKDYGISFGGLTETGSVILGDDVKIHVNAEFVKQAEAVAA